MDRRSLDEGASFSGHERNHLFLNLGGNEYVDVGAVAGLDHPGDSRAFAYLDFDRDGWQDFVVVNANAPFVQLYRNGMGSPRFQPESRTGFVAMRFVGSNHTPRARESASPRDGYGAMASVTAGDRTRVREHRAGEGMASQNSATMIVGLGEDPRADRISVRWPSGVTRDTVAIAAGSLVTAYEDPAQSPTGAAFVVEPYRRDTFRSLRPVIAAADGAGGPRLRVADKAVPGPRSSLVMYTTLATWCAPCLVELPALKHIRERFTEDELEMYGIPYDATEEIETLRSWADANGPSYRILAELSEEDENLVKDAIMKKLRFDGLPATIVTTGDGRVVFAKWGPPTVSEIRQILVREKRGYRADG